MISATASRSATRNGAPIAGQRNEHIDVGCIRPRPRQGLLRAVISEEEHPVLAPGVTHRDEHELPSTPRVERMGHPNSSLTTGGIGCR